MATVAENLQSIIDAKADIKAALIEQGQTPTNEFSTYGNLIRNIQKPAYELEERMAYSDAIKTGEITEVYNVNQ